MRLLIEFFRIHGHKPKKDFTAPKSFNSRITKSDKKVLIKIWEISSSHVNHLGLERANYKNSSDAPYEYVELVHSAKLILDISFQFADYLGNRDDPFLENIKLVNKTSLKLLN